MALPTLPSTSLTTTPNATIYEVIDAQGNSHGIGQRCHIPYSKERLLSDFMTFHFRLMRRSVYEQVGGIDPSTRAVPGIVGA
jgi:hypothetical protein